VVAAASEAVEPLGAPPIVELSNVRRTFGTDARVVALRDIDLMVQPGEWVAVVGASGSGKTTLLNIIGCLDRQDSGSYRFDGMDVAELTDAQRAGLRSRDIGFVFQSFHLLSYRTVLENVMLAEVYGRRPRAGRSARALEAIEAVGLESRIDFLPTKLSGGQQQRVAIARALVKHPRLLLCDEPTGNLDTVSSRGILELLSELHRSGQTIITITHDPSVAARAQRQATIVDGHVDHVD
jgi:ABC-type lipoprotein export system ATPase subunit